jgi:hypothetical protein
MGIYIEADYEKHGYHTSGVKGDALWALSKGLTLFLSGYLLLSIDNALIFKI